MSSTNSPAGFSSLSTATASPSAPAANKKRKSKWDTLSPTPPRSGPGRADDGEADAERLEVQLARAKAAAKASRARQKALRAEASRIGEGSASPATCSASTAAIPFRADEPDLNEHKRIRITATSAGIESPSSSSAPSRRTSTAVGPLTPPRRRPPPAPVPPRDAHPSISGCRSVYSYERLNHIEEGSYGVVFRARDRETGEIVALKKLKMEKERNGFPITSLREIHTLMQARHPNVVEVREIVVGDTLTQIYIVMEFVEHDLKTLLSSMRTPFLQSEIKTLMMQLLSAISLLHSNWIMHRDLKTSNLLMNNRGMMKLADFGLARTYGEPLGDMTTLVVTLWYRAPELLLGSPTYTEKIDIWSIGCIFGELITQSPLFPGKAEADQLHRIFRLLGVPNETIWPGFSTLPNSKTLSLPPMHSDATPPTTKGSIMTALRAKFKYVTENGLDLLSKLLCYDPTQRISAHEALQHPYFKESPAPAHPDSFGSFPSIAAGEKRRDPSPDAPQRLADQKLAYQLEFDL